MKDRIFWFIAAVVYLSILFTLVRPNSKGPFLVGAVLGALTDLVKGAAGYSYNNGTWSAPNGNATTAQ
jgi:hypothetical protein